MRRMRSKNVKTIVHDIDLSKKGKGVRLLVWGCARISAGPQKVVESSLIERVSSYKNLETGVTFMDVAAGGGEHQKESSSREPGVSYRVGGRGGDGVGRFLLRKSSIRASIGSR